MIILVFLCPNRLVRSRIRAFRACDTGSNPVWGVFIIQRIYKEWVFFLFMDLNLQAKEKIYAQGKPNKLGFILSRFVSRFILYIILILFFSWPFLLARAKPLNISLILLLFALLLYNLIASFIAYTKYKYWITNFRVIGSRGVISYSIESIPLENITDVTLNRSIIDRFLNQSSLLIVPIGGLATRRGGPNYFPALGRTQALELQKLIFNLRDEKKNK